MMVRSCASEPEDSVEAAKETWAEYQLGDVGVGACASDMVAPAMTQRMIDFEVDPARTDWNFSSNGRKVVYLTIDDGPSDKTEQILDILDRYGCKATFFVIGRDGEHFPIIKEAFLRGHTIGLHSYTHDYAHIYSSEQAYYDDLNSIGEAVREQIGFVPAFIRFPGGSSNTISKNYSAGIMSRVTQGVQSMGYQYWDWNVSSGDGADISTEAFVSNCTVDATEYDNIVMLMHDSAAKQASVDGLPAVIEYWQAKGYTFEAIDRNSFVAHHGVNN